MAVCSWVVFVRLDVGGPGMPGVGADPGKGSGSDPVTRPMRSTHSDRKRDR